MRFKKDYMPSLAGSLLVAHPVMMDPNFQRSVILISAHSMEQGGLGVVLNAPLGKTMGEFDLKYAVGPLSDIPMYLGGPVGKQGIMLVAWEWLEHNSIFKLHFGISVEQAVTLLERGEGYQVKAFLGHTLWKKGQLEGELHQHIWLLSSVKNMLISQKESDLWKDILAKIKPELFFLVDPEDPSLN